MQYLIDPEGQAWAITSIGNDAIDTGLSRVTGKRRPTKRFRTSDRTIKVPRVSDEVLYFSTEAVQQWKRVTSLVELFAYLDAKKLRRKGIKSGY
jgi:hypothetical protein